MANRFCLLNTVLNQIPFRGIFNFFLCPKWGNERTCGLRVWLDTSGSWLVAQNLQLGEMMTPRQARQRKTIKVFSFASTWPCLPMRRLGYHNEINALYTVQGSQWNDSTRYTVASLWLSYMPANSTVNLSALRQFNYSLLSLCSRLLSW